MKIGQRKEEPPERDERTDEVLARLTGVTERLERLADQLAAPKPASPKP